MWIAAAMCVCVCVCVCVCARARACACLYLRVHCAAQETDSGAHSWNAADTANTVEGEQVSSLELEVGKASS